MTHELFSPFLCEWLDFPGFYFFSDVHTKEKIDIFGRHYQNQLHNELLILRGHIHGDHLK